eukprot:600558-Rhodomonas_salina.1
MEIIGYVVQNAPGYQGSLGKMLKIEIMGFVVQIAPRYPRYLCKTYQKFADWSYPVPGCPSKTG